MIGQKEYILLREKLGEMDSPKYDEVYAMPLRRTKEGYAVADVLELTPEEVLFPSKKCDIGIFYFKSGKIVGLEIASLKSHCP